VGLPISAFSLCSTEVERDLGGAKLTGSGYYVKQQPIKCAFRSIVNMGSV
jgi:hypothetical protein